MGFQNIIENKRFIQLQDSLDKLEEDRIYCLHGISHSLDVARIAYIMMLEDGIDINQDVLYGAALLHDLGRSVDMVKHNEKSVDIARSLLPECGYNTSQIDEIVEIIESHSGELPIEEIQRLRQDKNLDVKSYFKIADQLSRNCFCCKAASTCKWDMDTRIKNITV